MPEMPEHENPFAAPLASDTPTDIDSSFASSDAEELRKKNLNHEASIKDVGTLYLLSGALTIFLGVLAQFGLLVEALWGQGFDGAFAVAAIGCVICLGMGVGFWALGKGIRQLQPWARSWGIGVSALGLLGFPIGTLIHGYFLYLFASRKGKIIMTEEYQAAVAATPHIKYKTSIVVWILLGLLVLLFVGVIARAIS